MVKKNERVRGRNLALTIILGVFISIMLIVFVNLVVSYAYPSPEYKDYCEDTRYSKLIQDQKECEDIGGRWTAQSIQCITEPCPQGYCEYDYTCGKNYEEASKIHNRNAFFIFATIGFALIVFGLFYNQLLLQIISLPAGAFLVIEAAVKNFDDKLIVIIVFALLIIAAIYLAMKKLR